MIKVCFLYIRAEFNCFMIFSLLISQTFSSKLKDVICFVNEVLLLEVIRGITLPQKTDIMQLFYGV